MVLKAGGDGGDWYIEAQFSKPEKNTSFAFVSPDNFMRKKINEFRLNVFVVSCKKRHFNANT